VGEGFVAERPRAGDPPPLRPGSAAAGAARPQAGRGRPGARGGTIVGREGRELVRGWGGVSGMGVRWARGTAAVVLRVFKSPVAVQLRSVCFAPIMPEVPQEGYKLRY
jgi:hypothetical protein